MKAYDYVLDYYIMIYEDLLLLSHFKEMKIVIEGISLLYLKFYMWC